MSFTRGNLNPDDLQVDDDLFFDTVPSQPHGSQNQQRATFVHEAASTNQIGNREVVPSNAEIPSTVEAVTQPAVGLSPPYTGQYMEEKSVPTYWKAKPTLASLPEPSLLATPTLATDSFLADAGQSSQSHLDDKSTGMDPLSTKASVNPSSLKAGTNDTPSTIPATSSHPLSSSKLNATKNASQIHFASSLYPDSAQSMSSSTFASAATANVETHPPQALPLYASSYQLGSDLYNESSAPSSYTDFPHAPRSGNARSNREEAQEWEGITPAASLLPLAAIDSFLHAMYEYYRHGGSARIVAARLNFLFTSFFAYCVSIFLLVVVHWYDVFFCDHAHAASTCSMLQWHNLTYIFSFRSAYYVWLSGYVVLAFLYWMWLMLSTLSSIRKTNRVQILFSDIFKIPDEQLSLLTWKDVCVVLQLHSKTLFGVQAKVHAPENQSMLEKLNVSDTNPELEENSEFQDAIDYLSHYRISQRLCRRTDFFTYLLSERHLALGMPSLRTVFQYGQQLFQNTQSTDFRDPDVPMSPSTIPADNNNEYRLNMTADVSDQYSSYSQSQAYSIPPASPSSPSGLDWQSYQPWLHASSLPPLPRSCLYLSPLLEWVINGYIIDAVVPAEDATDAIDSVPWDDIHAKKCVDATHLREFAVQSPFNAAATPLPALVHEVRRSLFRLSMLLLMVLPYLFIITTVNIFVRYVDEFRSSSSEKFQKSGKNANSEENPTPSYHWSLHSTYIYRHYLELPHLQERRLTLAADAAEHILHSVQSSPWITVMQTPYYMLGATTGILLVLSLADSDVLTKYYVFGRNLLSYLAILTAALTICRSLLPKPYMAYIQPQRALGRCLALLGIEPTLWSRYEPQRTDKGDSQSFFYLWEDPEAGEEDEVRQSREDWEEDQGILRYRSFRTALKTQPLPTFGTQKPSENPRKLENPFSRVAFAIQTHLHRPYLILLSEIACVFLTPFVLMFSVHASVPQACAALQQQAVWVSQVGTVCNRACLARAAEEAVLRCASNPAVAQSDKPRGQRSEAEAKQSGEDTEAMMLSPRELVDVLRSGSVSTLRNITASMFSQRMLALNAPALYSVLRQYMAVGKASQSWRSEGSRYVASSSLGSVTNAENGEDAADSYAVDVNSDVLRDIILQYVLIRFGRQEKSLLSKSKDVNFRGGIYTFNPYQRMTIPEMSVAIALASQHHRLDRHIRTTSWSQHTPILPLGVKHVRSNHATDKTKSLEREDAVIGVLPLHPSTDVLVAVGEVMWALCVAAGMGSLSAPRNSGKMDVISRNPRSGVSLCMQAWSAPMLTSSSSNLQSSVLHGKAVALPVAAHVAACAHAIGLVDIVVPTQNMPLEPSTHEKHDIRTNLNSKGDGYGTLSEDCSATQRVAGDSKMIIQRDEVWPNVGEAKSLRSLLAYMLTDSYVE